MTRQVLFISMIYILLTSSQSIAQDNWHSSDVGVAENLRRVASILSEDKYFERMISLGYVSSPEKSDISRPHWFRKENTYIYLKLSFDTSRVVDNKDYLIGKAFYSERYLERDYRELSKAKDEITKDGINMFCKLYYDRKNLEFRLNVYPDIITDVCRAGMHGNKRVCKAQEDNHLMAIYIHDSLASRLVAQPDSYYNDFLKSKMTSDRKFNHQKSPELYYVKNKQEQYEKKDDVLAKNNYRKHIKNFSVVDWNTEGDKNTKLILQFTKYAGSDDFIENNSYEFNSKKINQSVVSKVAYLTENSWNRTLIESDYPDDVAISELNSENSDWYYMDGKTEIYSQGRINLRNLEIAKASKSLSAIEKTLNEKDQQQSEMLKQIESIDTNIGNLSTRRTNVDDLLGVTRKQLKDFQSKRDSVTKIVDPKINQIYSVAKAPLSDLKSTGIIRIDTLLIVLNDSTTAKSAISLADTSETKLVSFSNKFGSNISNIVVSERNFNKLVVRETDSVATYRTHLLNLDNQIATEKTRRQRLLYSLDLTSSQKDSLLRSDSVLTRNIDRLKIGFSDKSQNLPFRKERWIYFGRWRTSDSLEFDYDTMDVNVFNRFLFANYNKTIAIRDSLPVQVERYYYRGGIAETIEVVYGKYKEKSVEMEKVRHRKYPKPRSRRREDFHRYFLIWRSREDLSNVESVRTLKLAGNSDVTAFCIRPIHYQHIDVKGYRYIWAKIMVTDD